MAAKEIIEALFNYHPSAPNRSAHSGSKPAPGGSAARQEYHCRACGAANWLDRPRCRTCGEPRPDSTRVPGKAAQGSRRGTRAPEKPPWRKPSVSPSSRPSTSPSPTNRTAPSAATTPVQAARAHRSEANVDVVTRIKNLENLRRTARAASEHDLADQLTAQIDALRKERAQARPLRDRLTSALRKQELAQHDLAKASEALQKATERRSAAAATVAEATRELEELRREEQEQQAGPGMDPPEDHLLEYFDELVDAVQATPDARTARILSALNAVRTILLKDAEYVDADAGDTADSYHHDMDVAEGSVHSGMVHETSTSRASTPSPRSSSPDHNTSSKRASVQHFDLTNGTASSDHGNEHHHSRSRGSQPNTTSSRRRSRSPTARR